MGRRPTLGRGRGSLRRRFGRGQVEKGRPSGSRASRWRLSARRARGVSSFSGSEEDESWSGSGSGAGLGGWRGWAGLSLWCWRVGGAGWACASRVERRSGQASDTAAAAIMTVGSTLADRKPHNLAKKNQKKRIYIKIVHNSSPSQLFFTPVNNASACTDHARDPRDDITHSPPARPRPGCPTGRRHVASANVADVFSSPLISPPPIASQQCQ